MRGSRKIDRNTNEGRGTLAVIEGRHGASRDVVAGEVVKMMA